MAEGFRLRLNFVIGIQHNDFRTNAIFALQVVGNHAGTLIRSRRAAIGRLGHCHYENVIVTHGSQLIS